MIEKIGIMADSHGSVTAIEKAVLFFNNEGCRRLYHLGDFCDSGRPEDADPSAAFLKKHQVITVKGNNDHIIYTNYKDRPGRLVSQSTIAYLEDMPQVVTYKHAFFSHSLPFEKELGLAGMMWDVSIASAFNFFESSPRSILFRGHSHTPEIKYQVDSRVVCDKIHSGQEIHLDEFIPCIVTCGALMSGLCMIWEPDTNILYSLSFT